MAHQLFGSPKLMWAIKGVFNMKPWSGKDFEYLGLYVKNNKKIGYFEVFDKNGNLLFRQDNCSHASVTTVKKKVEEFQRKL